MKTFARKTCVLMYQTFHFEDISMAVGEDWKGSKEMQCERSREREKNKE